ncbi:hypothetical protein C2S52_006594 [Perilla frutescens var. hirtella]|nr:hypothetical protein C2S52_006594 [Perilla frutescens var. hirtella]
MAAQRLFFAQVQGEIDVGEAEGKETNVCGRLTKPESMGVDDHVSTMVMPPR